MLAASTTTDSTSRLDSNKARQHQLAGLAVRDMLALAAAPGTQHWHPALGFEGVADMVAGVNGDIALRGITSVQLNRNSHRLSSELRTFPSK